MTVKGVVAALLDPRGEPRDGVTVLGGEPFYQPTGLAKLLRILQARDVHTTVYTGYTAEALARLPDPKVCNALRAIDLLIDGPFVREASSNAGEWRGSRNQRFIRHPGRLIAHREVIGWIDEV
jgi:anaerobic ribonucleoside-triphosphate reductase activating protein